MIRNGWAKGLLPVGGAGLWSLLFLLHLGRHRIGVIVEIHGLEHFNIEMLYYFATLIP